MGVYPIEGYIVECDECGEEDIYYENADYYTGLDVDHYFEQHVESLKNKGWIIDDGKVLCPKCANKKKNRKVKKR
jgi:formylmethanofuran dehydrogenase subunit E